MTTTPTLTLTAFLEARIADDEAAVLDGWDSDGKARVATVWTGGEPGYTTVASDAGDGRWVADGRVVADARHAHVLFDPARVLAECGAKRRIVEMAQREIHVADLKVGDDYQRTFDGGSAFFAHNTLLLLAAVYSDHPDYREEWRP